MLAPVVTPVMSLASNGGTTAKVLVRAGVLRPLLPSQLITLGRVLAAWGTGPAGGFTLMAVLDPIVMASSTSAGRSPSA